jgi:tripartite-type tricarboxylate transporter receptor subunit TctC
MTARLSLPVLLPCIAVAASLAVPAGTARAQSIEEFYKNKNVKVISSSGVGGGYDTYARLLARIMPRYLPGKPNMIVQNMPGAGGVKASNYLFNAAPKDGSVLGGVHRTVPQAKLLGIPGVQFDATKFNWLGSLANEVSVCTSWHDTPVKTMKDAMEKELIVGGSGATDTEQFPAVLNNIIGTKFRIVSGYVNGPAIVLAMERREVDGRCGWSWSSIETQFPTWIKEKKINILGQITLEKHPDLQHVPLVLDFAKTQEDREVLEFLFARQVMGRPYLAPPGVPEDRVKALRAAFSMMVKDKAGAADFKKANQELTPVSGEYIQNLVAKFHKTPKPVIQKAIDASQWRGPAKTMAKSQPEQKKKKKKKKSSE